MLHPNVYWHWIALAWNTFQSSETAMYHSNSNYWSSLQCLWCSSKIQILTEFWQKAKKIKVYYYHYCYYTEIGWLVGSKQQIITQSTHMYLGNIWMCVFTNQHRIRLEHCCAEWQLRPLGHTWEHPDISSTTNKTEQYCFNNTFIHLHLCVYSLTTNNLFKKYWKHLKL